MSILQRVNAYLATKNINIRVKNEDDAHTVFYNRGCVVRESDWKHYFSWDVWFKPEVQFGVRIKKHCVSLSLAGLHVNASIDDDADPGEREWSVSFHDGTVFWCLGFSDMSWSRSEGWRHSWWNAVDTLLGKPDYKSEVVREEVVRFSILGDDGPELHEGKAQLTRDSWKRPRWFKKEITRVRLDFEKGVPSGHKGPTFSSCAPARTIEQGLGEFIGHILERRRR